MAYALPLPDLGLIVKKYVVSLILLAAVVGGFWYGQRYFNRAVIPNDDQSMIPAIGATKGTSSAVYYVPGPVDPTSLTPLESIVLFQHPGKKGQYVCARVIGLPGDEIKIVDGQIFRNGESIAPKEVDYLMRTIQSFYLESERFKGLRRMGPDLFVGKDKVEPGSGSWREIYGNDTVWLIVPKDCIYVLADRRSGYAFQDSRGMGPLLARRIVGVVRRSILTAFEDVPSKPDGGK